MRAILICTLFVFLYLEASCQNDCASVYRVDKRYLKYADTTLYSFNNGKTKAYRFEPKLQRNTFFVELPDTAKRDGVYCAVFSSDTNVIAIETTYRNSLRDGIEKTYFVSGKLREETSFKNGKRDGLSKSYYETGILEAEASYSNGNFVRRTYYYANGRVNYISVKDSGNRYWNRKGRIIGKSWYENKVYKSVFNLEWHLLGSIKHDITEVGDTSFERTYYANGKVKSLRTTLTIHTDPCNHQTRELGEKRYWNRWGREIMKKKLFPGV